jgi:hypothetical protein
MSITLDRIDQLETMIQNHIKASLPPCQALQLQVATSVLASELRLRVFAENLSPAPAPASPSSFGI